MTEVNELINESELP